jgi:hypothetical protein
MMLTVHILLKDLRRHRWEVAIYLVSIVGWSIQEAHPNQWIKSNASALFPILMFVIWFLLIIRAVQGEALIGTREFWTTRPYRTGSLMVAKLAFLIVSLHVPLFLAQCWLLTQAGFALTGPTLLRLVLLQLEFFSILTLPAAALASITRSIVQWVLAIIGGVLGGFVISWLPWGSLTPSLEGTELLSTTIGFLVVAALLIVLLLWQYNRRGPLAARILFGAAGLVVPLCIVLASTSLARSVAYPRGPADAPIHLALSSAPERQYSRTDYVPQESNLLFPVEGATTSPDMVAVIEGVRLHFTAPDGWSSKSEWSKWGITLSPEQNSRSLSIAVNASVADKIATTHPNVEAELAIALYHLNPSQRLDTSAAQFDLSGSATCKWGDRLDLQRYRLLECAAPLRLPDVYTVHLDSAETTCLLPDHTSRIPTGHRAERVQVAGNDLPVDFNPNPIRNFLPDLGGAGLWEPLIPTEDTYDPNSSLGATICQGTPFTLRTGRFQERMSVSIPLGNLGKENRTTMQVTLRAR